MGAEESRVSESKRPRVIVCGECDDRAFVFRKLDRLLAKLREPIICLQGRTSGLDKFVNEWAFKKGLTRKIFHPARMDTIHRMLAIEEMVGYADEREPSFCIIFGTSQVVQWTIATDLVTRHIEVK